MQDGSYPNCERLAARSDDRVAITNFMQWLGEQSVVLARWGDDGSLQPMRLPLDLLVLRWMGINEVALEKERSALLRSITEQNNK